MRSFDEFHGATFKGMGEKEEVQGNGLFPMGLMVDMEKLRKLTRERCPKCGKTSQVIDRIEFKRTWDSVESYHQGVNSDHIILGGFYRMICGEEGCNFEHEESIPVELYNRKPQILKVWDDDDDDDEIEGLSSPILIIERELSQEEIDQVKKDDKEYCEENDIEYCEEDWKISINDNL